MSGLQQDWERVDAYIEASMLPVDAGLEGAQAASGAAGLPPISVAPNQGRLLQLLALTVGARRILEVGTLGGYSTIWLARALPAGGRLITLELDDRHAEVARANLDVAGVGDRVEIRVGPAARSLAAMETGRDGGFDLSFIDADKANGLTYAREALRLGRPGGLLVVDNVVRHGAVADAASDPAVVGSRAVLEWLGAEPALDATAIQTVGVKGWDGLALARIRD